MSFQHADRVTNLLASAWGQSKEPLPKLGVWKDKARIVTLGGKMVIFDLTRAHLELPDDELTKQVLAPAIAALRAQN